MLAEPIAGERKGIGCPTCVEQQAHRITAAIQAAAAAGVEHAHGDDILTVLQQTARPAIDARHDPANRCADLCAIHPGRLVVVNRAQMQEHIPAVPVLRQVKCAAKPENTVEIRIAGAFPKRRQRHRFPIVRVQIRRAPRGRRLGTRIHFFIPRTLPGLRFAFRQNRIGGEFF